MTYVMADVHGQYEKYRKMLDKIGMTAWDELYILGDVVDRGPEPMAILMDMDFNIDIIPILGNHDWTARTILSRLNTEITEENAEKVLTPELLQAVRLWLSDGGDTTLKDFRRLDAYDRRKVLDYLDLFAPFDEIEIDGIHYVLVHAGLGNFDPAKPLDDYTELEMCDTRTDYGRRYFENKILVTGHTPTLYIDPGSKGRIWRGNGHIALDCGAGFGLPLGCIRLDDGEEFYVE